ncbi:MAG TPA: double-strand break repair protein AddB [Alphaproteobacteria bacterium]|nr:double-strand break repair protein AddB [Alphaproteobacteria bacterium]
MTPAHPRVFTIPAGVPFVDALAAKLLAESSGDPLALGRSTVLLPTRRAVRSLREAFLRLSAGRALVLPRLMPIGDLDEDELAFAAADAPLSGAALEIPPVIPELRRRLLLAELILKLGRYTEEQAVLLAAELGRLIDQVETQGLGFDRLATLVPARYAAHWQITLDFLRIVTEHWPRVLAAEGAIDPAARRNRLLEAQVELWRANPPCDPIIAAGSTGSIPATAALLALIATLPQGRVVLPGLDRHLDAEAWESLEPSHPQYGLKRLLERIGIERRRVVDWSCDGVAASSPARAALIAEAMRPASSTEAWRRLGSLPPESLDGLRRIDCPTPREEAGVIALLMREALDTPGRRAALVTPDRALARRVAVELERWDIEVDDSAGTPLSATPPGAFLRLVAQVAAEAFAPLSLVALLKHPLAAGGVAVGAFRRQARLLEIFLLRGPRPAPGIAGLRAALRTAAERADRRGLVACIDRLERRLGAFADILAAKTATVPEIVAAHIAAAEALAASDAQTGAARLWAGDAGEQMALFLAELIRAAARFPPLAGAAYPAFFATLLAGQVVRPRYGRHPRLAIWGPLEARLQHADLLILGGLNEGTWPPEPPIDPWMSRPMRVEFGLPEPERRIGLSAHDFAQACCAREVVLTRALKVEGTPTVPSRWLLRLDNLLGAAGLAWNERDAKRWLAWQRALDRHDGPVTPAPPPAPRPPVPARPRRLSVTEIGVWMRDPYAIYAHHVLKLRALEPLDADPGAADRGTFIHEALDLFLRSYPEALPGDAVEQLLSIGEKVFGPLLERPGIRAFWWPRFERIARWFVAAERARRPILAESRSETPGTLVFEAPAGPFTLSAKADRIDRLKAGGLAIIDYKTGATPSPAEIELGLSPQLPLEAAMAQEGAFHGVAPAAVKELAFWRLSGGEPPGEERRFVVDAAELAREAFIGLLGLVSAFDDPSTPYAACPRPDHAPAFSDYEHLARVKEWSTVNGGSE